MHAGVRLRPSRHLGTPFIFFHGQAANGRTGNAACSMRRMIGSPPPGSELAREEVRYALVLEQQRFGDDFVNDSPIAMGGSPFGFSKAMRRAALLHLLTAFFRCDVAKTSRRNLTKRS